MRAPYEAQSSAQKTRDKTGKHALYCAETDMTRRAPAPSSAPEPSEKPPSSEAPRKQAAVGTQALLERVGERIAAARRGARWSQGELARRSGLSLRFLGQLEAGATNVSLERLDHLAQALGCPLAHLVRAEREGKPEDPLHGRLEALLLEHDSREVMELLELLSSLLRTKREVPRRIALLGIRGAGKSSVGALVAKALSFELVELDALVERRAGLPLATLFELHGEDAYRKHERQALAELLQRKAPLVIATGGSLVTDPAHFELLHRGAFTVWLKARPEDHWARVVAQGDFRPMRKHPRAMDDLRALFEARRPLYERAHWVIPTSNREVAEVAQEVTHRFRQALRAKAAP